MKSVVLSTGPPSLNWTIESPAVVCRASRSVRLLKGDSVQAELVVKARRGDREAFGALAAGTIDRLYATARLLLRDTELAEDAVQEAFTRAWRDLGSLRDPDRFEAWLYRMLVRICADLGRHRQRWRGSIVALPTEPAEADRSAELADRDQIERGLRRLSDAQQTVLILHYYVGLSGEEAADALGIPVGTAKSRLHYAIEALRAALDAEARTGRVRAREEQEA